MTRLKRNELTHRSQHYIGTVKNDKQGREVIRCLRVLYRPYGTVYTKGRNPNRKRLAEKYGLNRHNLQRSVPTKYSITLDLYLTFRQLDNETWPEYDNRANIVGVKGLPPYYEFPLGALKGLVIARVK